jgi:hypothetical protein
LKLKVTKRVNNKIRKKKISIRRYKSSSIDENEFIDYMENPALRLEFDMKR